MASKNRTEADSTLPISQHPLMQEPAALLAVFSHERNQTALQIDKIRVRRDQQRYGHIPQNREQLDYQLVEIEKQLKPVEPPKVAEQPKSKYGATVAAAMLKLNGGTPVPEHDEAAELKTLKEDLELWSAAAGHMSHIVDELRDVLSLEYWQAQRERNSALLLELYRKAQEFARMGAALSAFKLEGLAAGYVDRPDIAPYAMCAAVSTLGAESDFNSGLAHFRRQLEDLKIL